MNSENQPYVTSRGFFYISKYFYIRKLFCKEVILKEPFSRGGASTGGKRPHEKKWENSSDLDGERRVLMA